MDDPYRSDPQSGTNLPLSRPSAPPSSPLRRPLPEVRILFVDDEANLLAAIRRQLHNRFAVDTALSAAEGLDLLSSRGPYGVIVADLRMPVMDGIQFLRKARELSPESVRMILTGNTDLDTAIQAVNEGAVFRFLTKPCPPFTVIQALEAGLEQYRLVTAEKDLLEKTLGNSIRLVTEILSLASPAAYSRALRIRRITREITANLRVRDAWQYELAALFSQTGCVALPTGLVEKIYNGDTLSRNDTKLYASHPMIGARLLQDVPRMEITAEMIREQLRAYDQFPQAADSPEARKAALGAQILRAALDYDDLRRQGLEHAAAMDSLRERLGKYNPQVLDALQEKPAPVDEWRLLSTDSAGLLVGMVLDENVYSKEGALVMKKGQEISLPYLEQLQKLSDSTGLVEPFRVRVSQRDLQRVQDEQERRLR